MTYPSLATATQYLSSREYMASPTGPRDDTPEVFGLFGPSGTFYPVDDVLLAVHTEIVYCHA